MKKCSKCHDSKMVTDAGLQIVAKIKGKPSPHITTYPCPKCCKNLHIAVVKEYRRLNNIIQKHI